MAEPDTGALPASGRFRRIEDALLRIEETTENALARIEDKLVNLPQLADYTRLEGRVNDLERGTSPMGTVLLEQLRDARARLDRLEDLGSIQAQEATKLAKELDVRVRALHDEHLQRTAIVKSQASDVDKRRKQWTIGLGIVSAINALASLALAAHAAGII